MVGWPNEHPDIPGNGTGERWVWVDGEYVEYIVSQCTGRRMIIIQWDPVPFNGQRLPEYKPRRIPAPIVSMYDQPLYCSPARPVVTCVRNRLPCPDRREAR
jgi:hypothetical protein